MELEKKNKKVVFLPIIFHLYNKFSNEIKTKILILNNRSKQKISLMTLFSLECLQIEMKKNVICKEYTHKLDRKFNILNKKKYKSLKMYFYWRGSSPGARKKGFAIIWDLICGVEINLHCHLKPKSTIRSIIAFKILSS